MLNVLWVAQVVMLIIAPAHVIQRVPIVLEVIKTVHSAIRKRVYTLPRTDINKTMVFVLQIAAIFTNT